jgi:multimeric flavodoxin WrbA
LPGAGQVWQGKDGRAEVKKRGRADQGKRIAYFSALPRFLTSCSLRQLLGAAKQIIVGAPMTKILIVYHSQTGNTERMAKAVAEGAAGIEGAQVILKRAGDATLQDLLDCHGLAIGTPENFGYMSGMIKDFFDRTYYPAQGKVFRKPYVVFISAGNDGSGALRNIERIAIGYQFKKVYEPVISKGKLTEEILAKCRELGETLAGGCVEGIY